jgi:hypothetical protein
MRAYPLFISSGESSCGILPFPITNDIVNGRKTANAHIEHPPHFCLVQKKPNIE